MKKVYRLLSIVIALFMAGALTGCASARFPANELPGQAPGDMSDLPR